MTPCGEDSQRFCAPARVVESRSTMRSEGNARPLPRPSTPFPGVLLGRQRQRRWSELVLQLRVDHAPGDARSWQFHGYPERHRFRGPAIAALAAVLTRHAGAPIDTSPARLRGRHGRPPADESLPERGAPVGMIGLLATYVLRGQLHFVSGSRDRCAPPATWGAHDGRYQHEGSPHPHDSAWIVGQRSSTLGKARR
jgi:hypothetical protein